MIWLILQLLAAQTPTNVVYASEVDVIGPLTNQWLFLSNGCIVLPPFEFANEAEGANGISGAIYFASAGSVGMDSAPHYLVNLVHRGIGGGQLLISHQSIDIEEQSVGEIVLGNDISTAGIIRVRYSDFGGANLRTNQPGHAHPIVFDPRIKMADGSIHGSVPGIVAYHGGGPDEARQGNLRGWGMAGRGEIAFYTFVPWSDSKENLTGGIEMGRLRTNGWTFRGNLIQQRLVRVEDGPVCEIDLNAAYMTDVTLTTNTVMYSTGPRMGPDDVCRSAVLVRAGPVPRILRCPMWIPRSPAPLKAAIPMPANSKLWIDLDTIPGETYATFHFAPP